MVAWQDHLGSDPSICGGVLCAVGTRVPVTVILDSLAEGATREETLASYTFLNAAHIDAAIACAAELAHKLEAEKP